MRFWITKNSELPVREQIVRQVMLGILSDDLPEGQKLPSVRALARRHRIHANTVSAAYRDLMARGWLESRRGSGLYVRPIRAAAVGDAALDSLLKSLLGTARRQGHEPEEVLRRLEHLVRPRTYERIIVVDHDPGMREILEAEIRDSITIGVEVSNSDSLTGRTDLARSLVTALTTRAEAVRRALPADVTCVPLRLRSVMESLRGQPKPDASALLSVVSRSAEIREGARMMLIAVGLDPESLCEIDPAVDGWHDRLRMSAIVVTDVAMAKRLPAGCPARVFRVIADSSIEELKHLCGS